MCAMLSYLLTAQEILVEVCCKLNTTRLWRNFNVVKFRIYITGMVMHKKVEQMD